MWNENLTISKKILFGNNGLNSEVPENAFENGSIGLHGKLFAKREYLILF
jgi:hypothetical protein